MPLFVAMSRFSVDDERSEEVRAAFLNRPHNVEHMNGFVRMDVLRDKSSPGAFTLLTFWTDEECFREWHGSDAFRASHQNMPPWLKAGLTSADVSFMEYVTD